MTRKGIANSPSQKLDPPNPFPHTPSPKKQQNQWNHTFLPHLRHRSRSIHHKHFFLTSLPGSITDPQHAGFLAAVRARDANAFIAQDTLVTLLGTDE